jgi:hypothetical protein
MTLSPTRIDTSRENPDSAVLLIKEARRAKRLRRLRNVLTVLVALVIITVISVLQTVNKTPSKPRPETVVAKFVDSMKHADDTRFVATYCVRHYDWMGSGVITMAQIPSPPGTKAITNSDGYAASGKYAYVYRNADGRSSQWIKIGSNVSGCVMPPKGPIGHMECSRPSPYLPSNGFALADVGFVPTYVLQQMQNFAPKGLTKNVNLTERVSNSLGRLTCLTQTLTSTTIQTTCIDRSGYVVLWKYRDLHWSSSATLTAFNRHPNSSDFKTLIKPTQPLVLPGL